MATGRYGAALRQVHTLFGVGAIGNQSDGQLLERFASRREGAEAAFEALVARHGPMVLAVCRQVLGDAHDAADAFQATFLVLVRRAGSIRNQESVGPWLHGVALRVASRARADAARRRRREAREPQPAAFEPECESAADELRRSLLEEIARLPEKYRAPVVLCELEGRTHAEAARQLQWPIGTVSGRLSRARALLKSRILRRGLAFPAGLLLSTLAPRPVSAALVRSTARAALDRSRATAAAQALARLALPTRLAAGVKVAAVLVAAVGGLALMSDPGRAPGFVAPQSIDPPPRVATAPRPSPRPRPKVERTLALSPDGRTLASGGRDRTVTLWDMNSCRATGTMTGHSGPIVSLSFAADGRTLASASEDRTVKVWDLATGRELATLPWVPSAAGALAFTHPPTFTRGEPPKVAGNRGPILTFHTNT